MWNCPIFASAGKMLLAEHDGKCRGILSCRSRIGQVRCFSDAGCCWCSRSVFVLGMCSLNERQESSDGWAGKCRRKTAHKPEPRWCGNVRRLWRRLQNRLAVSERTGLPKATRSVSRWWVSWLWTVSCRSDTSSSTSYGCCPSRLSIFSSCFCSRLCVLVCYLLTFCHSSSMPSRGMPL